MALFVNIGLLARNLTTGPATTHLIMTFYDIQIQPRAKAFQVFLQTIFSRRDISQRGKLKYHKTLEIGGALTLILEPTADQAKQATINFDIIRVSEFNVTTRDINSHINNSCQ